MLDELAQSDGGGAPASQAYWNALKKLRSAWQEVYGEELEARGSRAMQRFEDALDNLKQRLKKEDDNGIRILEILDVQQGEDIAKILLGQADVDDLSPNFVDAAIINQAKKLGSGRHELSALMSPVLKAVFKDANVREPRFGSNRHWPRLRQYLREIEVATDWSPDGHGLKLANAGGRGPVAKYPVDPSRLHVIINTDYL